jgi:magnesium chelatase family protein
MRPGEISLATGGVLFLDELGEFQPAALDSLRQPLEEGVARVSRARASVTYPERFLLVGAMNPCPCGGSGSPGGCRCSDMSRARYHRRISGPLLDRFDLRIEVHRAAPSDLLGGVAGESSECVAARVARVRALARGRGVPSNAVMSTRQLDEHAALDAAATRAVEAALADGRLSARGYNRVRAVARTLADLGGVAGPIGEGHLLSALLLRAPLAIFRGATSDV